MPGPNPPGRSAHSDHMVGGFHNYEHPREAPGTRDSREQAKARNDAAASKPTSPAPMANVGPNARAAVNQSATSA